MSSATTKQGRLLSEMDSNTSRADLGKKMEDMISSVNEQRTDHATFRSSLVALLDELKHMCLAYAGLSKGSTASRVKHLAVQFLVGGQTYSAAAASAAFTASSHDIVALSNDVNARGYNLCLSSDGTALITASAATGGGSAASFPARTSAQALIGRVKVVVASGSTEFNASTDALTAAHLTTTFSNLGFDVDNLVDPPATITASAVGTLS